MRRGKPKKTTPIGNKLREARLRAGLTQIELSRKTGFPQSTIARIEAGIVKRPQLGTIYTLAHAMGIKAKDLLEK